MSSVANRDEAEKCVAIARQALQAGDRDKAFRWLTKSLRLYETSEAKSLLARLQQSDAANGSDSTSSSSQSSAHTHTQSTTTRRTSTTTTTSTDNDSKTSVSYTEEELQVVQQIKGGKNHYEILGVQKTCDEKAIKVAYRKLAIKVHPDKNKAPGADDAFKLVSNAFQILSDSSKRKHYDMTGDDPGSSASQQRAAYQQATRNAFYTNVEDDITPEDIFNMFFSGMAGVNARPRQYQRTQRQYQSPFEQQRSAFYRAQQQQQQARGQQQQQQTGFSPSQFMHLIPILLLVLFSMFSMPTTDDKPFSLHKSAQQPVHRQTKQWESPYYVDRSFSSRYGRDPRAVHQVEQQVEQAWYNEYKGQCVNQQAAKNKAKEQARQAKGASQVEAMKRAEAMSVDACAKAMEQLKHV